MDNLTISEIVEKIKSTNQNIIDTEKSRKKKGRPKKIPTFPELWIYSRAVLKKYKNDLSNLKYEECIDESSNSISFKLEFVRNILHEYESESGLNSADRVLNILEHVIPDTQFKKTIEPIDIIRTRTHFTNLKYFLEIDSVYSDAPSDIKDIGMKEYISHMVFEHLYYLVYYCLNEQPKKSEEKTHSEKKTKMKK